MRAAEFQAALQALLRQASHAADNVACLACEGCQRCRECTFCVSSTGLARSHYCLGCADCTDCTHCRRSTACLSCHYCVESERCTASAYLVRSVACGGCTHCFGCVGLQKRDFHVLNEPYERAAYFELTRRLARELRLELP